MENSPGLGMTLFENCQKTTGLSPQTSRDLNQKAWLTELSPHRFLQKSYAFQNLNLQKEKSPRIPEWGGGSDFQCCHVVVLKNAHFLTKNYMSAKETVWLKKQSVETIPEKAKMLDFTDKDFISTL